MSHRDGGRPSCQRSETFVEGSVTESCVFICEIIRVREVSVYVQGYIFGGLIAGPLGWRAAFLIEAAAMVPFVLFCALAPPLNLKGMDTGVSPFDMVETQMSLLVEAAVMGPETLFCALAPPETLKGMDTGVSSWECLTRLRECLFEPLALIISETVFQDGDLHGGLP